MSNSRPGKLGNPAQRAEIRAEVYRMSLRGMSQTAIGKEMGFSHETARTLIREYIEQLTVPLAEQMRKAEDDKLSRREAKLWGFLEGTYDTVSHGKVVLKATGEPVTDLDPVFKADAALQRIAERRAALWGLNTPVKTEHIVSSTSPVDDNIARLIEEMNTRNAEEVQKLSD